jgi:hypothetical protein
LLIAIYNNFTFYCQNLEDLWCIEYIIPLKDNTIIDMIREVVIWIFLVIKNILTFKSGSGKSIRNLGLEIISLIHYWSSIKDSQFNSNVYLVLSTSIQDMHMSITKKN